MGSGRARLARPRDACRRFAGANANGVATQSPGLVRPRTYPGWGSRERHQRQRRCVQDRPDRHLHHDAGSHPALSRRNPDGVGRDGKRPPRVGPLARSNPGLEDRSSSRFAPRTRMAGLQAPDGRQTTRRPNTRGPDSTRAREGTASVGELVAREQFELRMLPPTSARQTPVPSHLKARTPDLPRKT